MEDISADEVLSLTRRALAGVRPAPQIAAP
jgi:hypothetical protein